MAQQDRGILGIAAIAAATGLALAGLQQLLQRARAPLSRESSPQLLHRSGRFDPDPERRRQARLVQAQQLANDPASQARLLAGQGWGSTGTSRLLAPVSLKLEALARRQLGQQQRSQQLWRDLLQRFPQAPPSADALYYLGDRASSNHRTLLQRFPAHPAALAAAVDWPHQPGNSPGGLHLARWGPRWPGAIAALSDACGPGGKPPTPQQRDQLAAALAAQGQLAAGRRCLGGLPPQSQRSRELLGLAAPPAPSPQEQAWEHSRQLLLSQQWAAAQRSLKQQLAQLPPGPRAARAQFWLGLSAWQLGRRQQARSQWQQLLSNYPYGYYGWRASARLGLKPPALPSPAPASGLLPPALAQLEQLGLDNEAWEHWRSWRGGSAPQNPADLWREGQLRVAVGDRWIGLAQLDDAALAGAAVNPAQLALLTRQRHPLAHAETLGAAARAAKVDPLLLQAVARQESRLSPTVSSAAGAVGLLQLLPSTAQELGGAGITAARLMEPQLNAQLGGRYLSQMLREANGNAYLAVASYNAGAGAAGSWASPLLNQLPELWVEAIPYPETRIYVKSVLGNRWTYQLLQGRPTH